MRRSDILIEKILNGECVEDWKCKSRLEECLLACINQTGTEGLCPPKSRAEVLYQALAVKLQEGTGGGGGGATVENNTLILGSASISNGTLVI